jgi:hypothetical protein
MLWRASSVVTVMPYRDANGCVGHPIGMAISIDQVPSNACSSIRGNHDSDASVSETDDPDQVQNTCCPICGHFDSDSKTLFPVLERFPDFSFSFNLVLMIRG